MTKTDQDFGKLSKDIQVPNPKNWCVCLHYVYQQQGGKANPKALDSDIIKNSQCSTAAKQQCPKDP